VSAKCLPRRELAPHCGSVLTRRSDVFVNFEVFLRDLKPVAPTHGTAVCSERPVRAHIKITDSMASRVVQLRLHIQRLTPGRPREASCP
jgi:hypothetical protein